MAGVRIGKPSLAVVLFLERASELVFFCSESLGGVTSRSKHECSECWELGVC